MKKNYILIQLTILLISAIFSQKASSQVIISQIYEGTSNNKYIEFTNMGNTAVNFNGSTKYIVKLFGNKTEIGTNTPDNTDTLEGTLNPGASIVLKNSSAALPAYIVNQAVASSACNFNGKGTTASPNSSTDIIALYIGNTLSDVFSWGTKQYLDSTIIRKTSVVSPNATYTDSEWTSYAYATADNALPSTPEYLSYHGVPSSNPIIVINTPTEGETLASNTVNINFTVTNFTVGNPGAGTDGHIHYTLDNGAEVMQYTTDAITLSSLAEGNHKVVVWLVDNNHNSLNPAVKDSVNFTVSTAGLTDVANIAALRSQAADGTTVYRLTGESFITFTQTYRNQKFIQDASAAVLIDDPAGIITGSYIIGDGVQNVVGKLSVYGNMLQFTPTLNLSGKSSTGNITNPTVISLNQFHNDFETYEAQLVKIENVTFKDANGSTTFTTGKGFALTAALDSFRTSFYNADYIGSVVPTATVHVTGILNARSNANYITSRSLLDIQLVNNIEENIASNVSVYPNPAQNEITIKGNNISKIKISNVLGTEVMVSHMPETGKLNISELQSGVYFISVISNDNKVNTLRFIKQ